MQRAIALGGGGPAAGLHIGVLEGLAAANPKMKFDVWALSCIGAWVGIVYNQAAKGEELRQTYDFFKNGVFRDDVSYSRFPVNTVFGPDWFGNARALMAFMADPDNYKNIWLPDRILDAYRETISLLTDQAKWNEGDFNQWVLNCAFAANPFIRYLSSMMYLSNVTGLSRIYYPESTFVKAIKFGKLYKKRKPTIIHNAWNLSKRRLELFSNRTSKYKPITSASLCACSALPFIEGTVDIDGDTYCEGALVDTVNFKNLIDDFPDLDEIWISRIVDAKQVRKPKNLHDNLANLCQLFAATVGEDDVKLFKYHVKENNTWNGTIVEIRVNSRIDFTWSHANLDKGRRRGRKAAKKAYEVYMQETGGKKNDTGKVRIINEKKKDPDD